MTPPGMSLVSRVIPAARSAALLASPMWPSSRFTNTGLFGVTESIQSRRGKGDPGQRSWSQSPPRIHSPGPPLAGERLEPGDELRGRVGRPEIHAGELEAAVDEMEVAVHEARHHHGGAVGQDPRGRADQPRDVRAVAHGQRSNRPPPRRRRPRGVPSHRSRPDRRPRGWRARCGRWSSGTRVAAEASRSRAPAVGRTRIMGCSA